MELYRSPYEAYPFLCDADEDLRCDFELLTDEMASRTGLLAATVDDPALKAELLWLCELIYHMNPTLRTRLTVTEEEKDRLVQAALRLKGQSDGRCQLFVLTQGCPAACQAHLLRVQGKQAVRMLYRWMHRGNQVPPLLVDLANLLSGYFFYLALCLNQAAGVDEVPYERRNYTV